MNRTRTQQNEGQLVRLDYWPSTHTITTAQGKELPITGVGERWLLHKLTKGGLAMITRVNDTISVPPDCLSELV